MRVPQPFQYQGSKRALAPEILRYLPQTIPRLVEPFAGSAAVSVACAAVGRAREYWVNDSNRPLAELLNLIVNQPESLADAYQATWNAQHGETLEHYYREREAFNRTGDPQRLLYLLARCVKGAVRYNSEGQFNQSPDKRRRGTKPDRLRDNVLAVSRLLRGRCIVTSVDYRDVLGNVRDDDVVYMDPPYQGVCGARDARYRSGILFDDFVAALDGLNQRNVRFVVSYDGRLGDKSYGQPLPAYLAVTLIELEAGRSSQATLLGRNAVTVESLYLSKALARELGVISRSHQRPRQQEFQLLESHGRHDRVFKRVS